MTAYYNEIDPFAAQWLRNLIAAGLIAPGVVDERSIVDVRPSELAVFTQCHFFAGIGGWSLALRGAGWPDDKPVWTGSCPCQPFSVAGKGKGADDERHLWPVWFNLIRECRPSVVFGEQVAAAVGHNWLDAVQGDLEGEGYAIGSAVLGAHSVGAPHIRQRLWFVADATGGRQPRRIRERGQTERSEREAGGHGSAGLLADAGSKRRDGQSVHLRGRGQNEAGAEAAWGGADGILADADDTRSQGWGIGRDGSDQRAVGQNGLAGGVVIPNRAGRQWPADADRWPQGSSADNGTGPLHGFWRDADWLFCRDGKWRPVEPGTFPLAPGLPAALESLRAIEAAAIEEILKHGHASQGDAREALRMVRISLSEEAGREERATGVREQLHAPPLLLDFLLCLEAACSGAAERSGFEKAGAEVRQRIVRGVRGDNRPDGSSCRRRPNEQRPSESSDAVQALPLVLARHAEAYREAARSAHAASGRVGHLRAYGNAIVPQVAAQFITAFMEVKP